MHIFIWRVKEFFRLALVIVFVLLVAAVFLLANVSRFSTLEGERVFYLESASSQGLRSEKLKFSDLFSIRGESVILQRSATSELQELFTELQAEVLFTEEACGVTSYYAYSPKILDGVYVQGQKVNLHVAVNESRVVVGSPIIFDGF